MPRRVPDWDEYLMLGAEWAKIRSTCLSPAKGSVIAVENCIVSTGYNGTPRKTKNCNKGGCKRCSDRKAGKIKSGQALDICVCAHGEENAIVQAARSGVNIKGATLYTTYVPCSTCARMIINAGIRRVVAGQSYPQDLGVHLMREAGVVLEKFNRRTRKAEPT